MGGWNTRAEAVEYYRGLYHALEHVNEDLIHYRDMPERIIEDLNGLVKINPDRWPELTEADKEEIRKNNKAQYGEKITTLQVVHDRIRETMRVIDERIETEHPLEEEY